MQCNSNLLNYYLLFMLAMYSIKLRTVVFLDFLLLVMRFDPLCVYIYLYHRSPRDQTCR